MASHTGISSANRRIESDFPSVFGWECCKRAKPATDRMQAATLSAWVRMRFAFPLRLAMNLALLLGAALHCFGQRELFHEYGSSDGLANLNVKCLFQDRVGFLWVGTDNGLFRYDGSTFRGYGHADGLTNTEILSLAESPNGTLWVGTNSGVAQASGERFVSVDGSEEGATR